MRNIRYVMDQILDVIPDDSDCLGYNGKPALSYRFDKIHESSLYQAPEVQYLSWERLCNLLEDKLPAEMVPENPWIRDIMRIVNGDD